MIVSAGDPIASLGSIQSESALCTEVSHGFYMHAEGYKKERNEKNACFQIPNCNSREKIDSVTTLLDIQQHDV